MSAATSARVLVEEISSRLAPLEQEMNLAWWAASTSVTEAKEHRRVAAEIAMSEALADREQFARILGAFAAVDPGTDALLHRQLELLRDSCAPHQIDDELREQIITLSVEVSSTFDGFRPRLGDSSVDDNEIASILRTADDVTERKAAWEASKQIGAVVAERIRELAHLRNRAARELGYRDYFAMALATQELDEAWLLALFDDIDSATRRPFTEWKNELDGQLAQRFGVHLGELRPWHYDNVFFQAPPASASVDLDPYFVGRDLEGLTRRTFDGIGIDITSALAASDLTPRDGKNQHAYSVSIDRGRDVRVLCNNVASEQWAETMLHEFGHCAYSLGVDRSLPWLLRTEHPSVTEGVAIFFGHLSNDPVWLETIVGVDAGDIAALRPELDRALRGTLLTVTRWVLVMTNFERALYADPDGDLDTIWWDLVERYQLLRRPDERHAPDWAAKIHITASPVYYQNYLLGDLVALQLRATIESRFGGVVDRADVGRFLSEEVFRLGASLRWDELIEQATGHRLSADHLADALAL
ncbi:MAG: M2 family metallopeptidase [Acidimicrobiia bacterium]